MVTCTEFMSCDTAVFVQFVKDLTDLFRDRISDHVETAFKCHQDEVLNDG